MFSAGYKSYSAWVPSYLLDRPRKFVLHCLEKLSPAARISSNHITVESKCYSFIKVQSDRNIHKVAFNDNVSEKEGSECSQSSHPGKLPLPASYSRSNAQKEDNLVIENEKIPTKKQKKRRYCQIEKAESKLPVQPKRFKNSRVGSKADWNRQQRDCFLDINTGKIEKAAGRPKNRKQGKEQATTTQNINTFWVEETVVGDEISMSSSEDNSDDSSISDRDGSNSKTGETNIVMENDVVCIMDNSPEANQCGKSWLQIGNIILTAEDRDILDSKDMWLNDKLINAAQILLTKQFPHIAGFQDTLLQARPEVFVKFEDVEKQDDASSCGLFAIAFATMMCSGLDRRCFHLDIAKMRPHLKKCLIEGNLTLFPSTTKERSPNLGTLSSFRVHCGCRMPLDSDDVFDIEDCTLCSVSYHKSCVNLHKVTIKSIPGENKGICEECSNQCKVTSNIEISHTSGFHSKIQLIDDR
eukprot:gene1791-1996_t